MTVQQIADVIIDALWAQSKTHSNAADAPDVWQLGDERYIHIDGTIDVIALARAVAQAI